MSKQAERVKEVAGWKIWRLAREAGSAEPDSPESPGAELLGSVRDDLLERLEYNEDSVNKTRDDVSEVADVAPDVYTGPMWGQFVDLCAYREDPTELGFTGGNMEDGARICLYMIAERLCFAILDYIEEGEK